MGDADAKPLRDGMRHGQITGFVYRWRPGDNAAQPVPNSQASANNGIEASHDGTIFVSSWGTKSIIRLTPTRDSYRRDELKLDFYTDNMRWGKNGRLLVTGQRYNANEMDSCYPLKCPIRWSIASINPKTLKIEKVYEDDGTNFSGATTALPVGRDMWLGSFVDEKVAIKVGSYNGL